MLGKCPSPTSKGSVKSGAMVMAPPPQEITRCPSGSGAHGSSVTGMRQSSYHTLSNNILGLLLQVVMDPGNQLGSCKGHSVFKMTASQYSEGLFLLETY